MTSKKYHNRGIKVTIKSLFLYGLTVICLNVGFSLGLSAQLRVNYGTTSFNEVMKQLSDLHSRYDYEDITNTYDEVKGSPFFTDDFISTDIEARNNEIIENVPTRMDLYINEIFAKDENGDEIILDKKRYKGITFEIDSESFTFKRLHPEHPADFYELYYDGAEVVIFKKYEIKLRKTENDGLSDSASKFVKANKYYVKNKSNNKTSRLKMNQRNLITYLTTAEIVAYNKTKRDMGMKSPKEKDFKRVFVEMSEELGVIE